MTAVGISCVLLSFALAAASCFDNGTFANAHVHGCVMMETDSSVVPGALVSVDNIDLFEDIDRTFTDSSGCYDYSRTYPTGDGDPISLLVTVTDVDGDTNGVFTSQDTLLYVEDTEENWDLDFQIDFHVGM